ncbi:MAG: peptidoglycan-binding protein [Deltaproteobacteria bacterium]|nr:peptidoglycan-binding protein [Deltaproteobacteria bacterium]
MGFSFTDFITGALGGGKSTDPQQDAAGPRKDAPPLKGTTFAEGEEKLSPGAGAGAARQAAPSTAAPSLAAIRSGAVLRPGQTGPAVASIAAMLARLGFTAPLAETFGSAASGAVSEFQTLFGVQANGTVGPQTLAALEMAVQCSVSAAQLIEILPTAPEAYIRANIKYINQSMYQGGMNTAQRKAMYIAQIAHESDRFNGLTEYASGKGYENRKDLGNTQRGDGPKFKGRGGIHLTGRANYKEASEHFGVDFVKNPELAAEPQWAFKIAEWYWTKHNLNDKSDEGAITAQTKVINGGTNGLADRKALYATAKRVLAKK